MLGRDKYLFTYPPDPQLCKKHRQASRIFKKYSNNATTQCCQCCDRRVGGEQAQSKSIIFDPIELAILGPGLPLFFCFIKNAIFLIFTFIVLYASFCLYEDKITGNCLQNQKCGDNFIDTFSILNDYNSISSLQHQLFCMLVFTVLSVLILQFLRNQVNKLNEKCDFLFDSPSDYAIMIRRLPEDIVEQDIQQMVEKLRQKLNNQENRKQSLQINHIILSFSMKNYRQTKQKNLINFKQSIKQKTNKNFQLQPFQGFSKSGDICIVVFERQQSKDAFKYQPSFTQNILQCFFSSCVPQSNFQVKGQKVCIQRAPEPDDIIWQNANVQIDQAIKRKTKFNLFGFGLLLIGCGIQYGLSLAQIKASQNVKTMLGIISSLVVSLSNFGILEFLRYASSKQKNLTHTEQNSVLMVKISFLQFLNARVFMLISKCLAVNSFQLTDTLIFEINTIMILNGLSHNICVFILDYFQISNKIHIYLQKIGFLNFTQMEANQIYQTPLPDMPYKYAYILKTMWLTAFYSSFVPFCAIYTFIGLILNYLVQKKLFAGTYSVPRMFSQALNAKAVKLMEFFPLSVSLGGMSVFLYSSNDVSGLCFVYFISSLGISLCILFLPFQKLTNKIFDSQKQSGSFYFDVYSELQKNFQITYEMTNPAYKQKRKRVKNDKIKKKIMIDDFNQITFDMNDIVSNNYRNKLQKVLFQIEEQRLQNEEQIFENQRQQRENQIYEDHMYERVNNSAFFSKKSRQQFKTHNPAIIKRKLRQLQIYDPITANKPQNQNKYSVNQFKNYIKDKDRIKFLVGCPFQKKLQLKDALLKNVQIQQIERDI